MNKLLVICGPTATGKTSLALRLAMQFGGELISADSRQVYQGMDIGTGKDLLAISNFQFPISNFKKDGIGCYEVYGIRVWGYDLVSPKKEFSVSQYTKIATKIIGNIWDRGKLPILVGGTGLYIKSVVDGIPTANIPKNRKLRKNLEGRGVDQLFEQLAQMDPVKAGSMNISDKKNSRRLIRAVEIAQFNITKRKKDVVITSGLKDTTDILFMGLELAKRDLEKRVKKRVEKRMKEGMEEEVRILKKNKVKWGSQAMNALGYKQFRRYFDGIITKSELEIEWAKEELNYAKRQLTWFVKDKRINWIDSSKSSYTKKVENMVKKWHNKEIKD